jgi:hypothetical protein
VAAEASALSLEVQEEGPVRYVRDDEGVARQERSFLDRSRPSVGAAGDAPLTRKIVDAVRATLPVGARVLVVSRGDDALLRLEERRADHFPQTDGGTYAGHHPADSAAAIAHVEALRARGAQYLLFPVTAFWWFEHYRDFRRHLEERYPIVLYRQDACALFALDRVAGEGPRLTLCREETAPSEVVGPPDSSAGAPVAWEPASPAAPAVDPSEPRRLLELDAQVTRLEGELGAMRKRMQRWEVVREVQRCVRQSVPGEARVLVVSRGDEALLELDCGMAEHFPQTEGGTYAGHYPANGSEAISHLEALRLAGSEFLVLPSSAFWWLDHYEALRLHLEKHARLLVRSGACLIYRLVDPIGAQPQEVGASAAAGSAV